MSSVEIRWAAPHEIPAAQACYARNDYGGRIVPQDRVLAAIVRQESEERVAERPEFSEPDDLPLWMDPAEGERLLALFCVGDPVADRQHLRLLSVVVARRFVHDQRRYRTRTMPSVSASCGRTRQPWP